jgi:molecular chaperone DnaK
MAADNQSLGRFELVGIPPAPRGVPQIEVSFDIDANGILQVSAKDLGTGTAQEIQVTAAGGLSSGEVDRLLSEAEQHAEQDAERRGQVELRNTAEGLLYSVEQSLTEYGAQLSDEEQQEIRETVATTRKALEEGEAEEIVAAVEDLQQLAYRMTEAVYERLGGVLPEAGDGAGNAPGEHGEGVLGDDEFLDS